MVAKIARQIQNQRTKRVDVAVRTAVALSDDEAEKLAGNLASLLGGRKPVLKREVDPSILGGLVVQVGDRVYDASIRTNLENFRQHLLNRRHREIRERRENLYQMPS
jgi:F-type H+-transporting ATPase subunit delta